MHTMTDTTTAHEGTPLEQRLYGNADSRSPWGKGEQMSAEASAKEPAKPQLTEAQALVQALVKHHEDAAKSLRTFAETAQEKGEGGPADDLALLILMAMLVPAMRGAEADIARKAAGLAERLANEVEAAKKAAKEANAAD